MTDVVFPVMPFADPGRPAIGVSLLSAAARRLGRSSRVLYFTFELAERLGLESYRRIGNGFPPDSLVGEWVFAELLFAEEIPDAERYVVDILGAYGLAPAQARDVMAARSHADAFVTECVERIEECKPAVVGFSTTFHQTCACLAVANRLKARSPSSLIVFGGANCEGEMGLQLLQSFECIDYVSTREADLSFPVFLEQVLTGAEYTSVPGIVGRGEAVSRDPQAVVTELDALPLPDYDDYFAALASSPLVSEIEPVLLVETSRGCWWGEKHHCTFCGLNGETMAFRRKSVERVIAEFEELSQTHGINRIECVDNILDMRFVGTLFPRLAESMLDLELFFEVKANLRHDQLVTLRQGGMRAIQPGIESFSDQVLGLMRKGCTGLQNIQLLRWCTELDLGVAWNILSGFPGEDPLEYEAMAEMLPLLFHLPPPSACSPFRLDRFSPFYEQSDELGISGVRPTHAYYYVFPFGRSDLRRLAYYFEFDFADGRDPHAYTRSVSGEVRRWLSGQSADPEQRPRLDAYWRDDGFDVLDTRPCAVAAEHRLEGLEAELYALCDSATSVDALVRGCSDHTEDDVRRALDSLDAKNLVVAVDRRYLSLAVMRSRGGVSPNARGHEAAPARSF